MSHAPHRRLVLLGLFIFGIHARAACFDVRLNDRTLFCITSGIGSISAPDRAGVIESRIKKIAGDYTFDPQSIAVTESEGAYAITGGDLNLVSLRERDLEDHADLETSARAIAESIRQSIGEYRARRSPRTILLGAIYTALSTLALIIALMVLGRGKRYLTIKASTFTEHYVANLKIKSYQLVSPHRIHQLLAALLTAARVLATLILFYVYVPLVLSFFPWTARWAPTIINAILDPVRNLASILIAYAPNLFYIAVILAFTHYTMKFVRLFFNEIELGNLSFNSFHKEWAQPTFKLLKVIAYAIAFVMIFPYLPGSSSPAFQGLSVFLGVLVSFGSGSAIANMISGIVMTYMRPFRLGDRVRIADTMGDVVEKTFLVTRIKTIKNVEITIPNALVLGSHIVNYSTSAQQDGLILHTTVTIGYDAPWIKVHQLLKTAAARTELLDRDKEPYVLQTSLDDFYVSYELNAFTRHANRMAKIYSDLHQNIQDAFNEGGVEIMSPHYGALRDGNEVTIPADHRAPGYRSPPFKISTQSSERTT